MSSDHFSTGQPASSYNETRTRCPATEQHSDIGLAGQISRFVTHENVWDILGRRVRERYDVNSMAELLLALQREWQRITLADTRKRIGNLVARGGDIRQAWRKMEDTRILEYIDFCVYYFCERTIPIMTTSFLLL